MNEAVGYIQKVNEGSIQILVPFERMWELEKKNITECRVILDDGRTISAIQRKKIYAIFRDIANWNGDVPEFIKEEMKCRFIETYGGNDFSLSDCTMELATEFINYLIDFCFLENIGTSDTMLNRTDDISHYLYSCLANRKCCICNEKGEIHHCEGSRVGMGFDRNKIDNVGRSAICLCRKHHNQAHQSEAEFFEKYKVYGIELDSYLVKKLKL